MKCLTCRWWDGEEDEMARCYAQPPVMHGGIHGEWPLTDEDARCPNYRRHFRKTLANIRWRLRCWLWRWWHRKRGR